MSAIGHRLSAFNYTEYIDLHPQNLAAGSGLSHVSVGSEESKGQTAGLSWKKSAATANQQPVLSSSTGNTTCNSSATQPTATYTQGGNMHFEMTTLTNDK